MLNFVRVDQRLDQVSCYRSLPDNQNDGEPPFVVHGPSSMGRAGPSSMGILVIGKAVLAADLIRTLRFYTIQQSCVSSALLDGFLGSP